MSVLYMRHSAIVIRIEFASQWAPLTPSLYGTALSEPSRACSAVPVHRGCACKISSQSPIQAFMLPENAIWREDEFVAPV